MATSMRSDPRGPARGADFRVDRIPKGINRTHRAYDSDVWRFARRDQWMYPNPYIPFDGIEYLKKKTTPIALAAESVNTLLGELSVDV